MFRKMSLALALIAVTGVAYGQAAGGWQQIKESHDTDYSVTCTRAREQGVVYSVFKNAVNIDFRVARDISVLYGPDGRPGSISLMRGFTSGSYHDVVALGSDTTCIIEKQ